MTGETYLSGHTVSYNYDQAGRLSAFTGYLGDGLPRAYATSISYNAASQMITEQFGTSTAPYHRMHYNSRLQLYDIRLGTDLNTSNDNPNPAYWTNGSWNRRALRLFYNSDLSDYNATPSGAGNNGNLYRADHFIPLDDNLSQWVMPVQYYSYDALNRVTGVSEFSDTYCERWFCASQR